MGILSQTSEILKLPLGVRAETALKAAVDELIQEHARNGWPLYVWQDGKVAEIPAEDLLRTSLKPT